MAQIGREEDARTGCEGSGLGGAGLEETWSGLEEVLAIGEDGGAARTFEDV